MRLDKTTAYKRRLRQKALSGYGDACSRCGDTEPYYLELHHRNNPGDATAVETGYGVKLCKWIIENNFPPDIILLCRKCHMILHKDIRFLKECANHEGVDEPVILVDINYRIKCGPCSYGKHNRAGA